MPAVESERTAGFPDRSTVAEGSVVGVTTGHVAVAQEGTGGGRRRIPGVALMFEGGGMRASYTSAMAVTLIEQRIDFDFVCGLSAGASNTVNYLSGDAARTRRSFVDLVREPQFGDWRTFVRGKGLFSAEWIYQEAGRPGGALPFDMDAFLRNPAELAIQAFDRDSGETVVWHKGDMPELDDVTVRVRASSTLPVAMPPVVIDGRTYYDGGLGRGGGIPLQLALDAGYTRVFAVLTRPRGFRKGAPNAMGRAVADLYRRYPKVREALLTRSERYNAELDRLEAMAERGDAYVVYADKMAVQNNTTDYDALVRSYEDGYAQAQAELPRWLEWLGA